ncbi:MAG: hypothetical protein LC798_05545, partial [Chloroflexi bacterium]|nr:hypothetical protein [Chloroflexota bacterium]
MPAPLAAAKLAWQAAGAAKQAKNGKGPIVGGAVGAIVLILFALAALGGGVATLVSRCNDESAAAPVDVGPVTARARADIPTRKTSPSIVTLATLTRLSSKLDIDWHFVASIAAQECDFGRCATVNAVNGSGCVGPMQLGVGGACGDFFGTYKTDGDGDGQIDPRDPEDAVATAIRGLKDGKGAPGRGGSYAQYRQASCGYYGACADASVNYADEVMARAVAYGFRGPGAPSGGNLDEAAAANAAPVSDAQPERTMLNLGDSLAVGIEEPLKTSLEGWTIQSDVAGSRPTATGVQRLSARDPGALPTVLVVSLGTNDSPSSTTAFRRHVTRVLEIAGPQRCVVWPTIRRPAQD